ncbi:MAG TPA: YciI family protein [Kofleriaceae bacterium]|nr:YciI family protein [Kofleriaceae bacterium]
MVMQKVDAKMEQGAPPSQAIIDQMGQLVGRYLEAGIFKDGAGLHRSAVRARVRFDGGTPTVTRGPYTGDNELAAGFALISTTGIDDAIERATQLGKAAGHREIEVGPVVERWDLTGSPRPADAPHRFLLVIKADAAFEAGAPPPAAVRALLDQWKRDGVLQSSVTLAPSQAATRAKVGPPNKRVWMDGPFTESKEMLAGFSILEVPSLADAKRFAEEYYTILVDNEVDIRPIVD